MEAFAPEKYSAPKMEEFAIVIPRWVTIFFLVLPHCGFLVVLPRQELSLCRRPACSFPAKISIL